MSRFRFIGLLAVAIAILAGCGQGGEEYVGSYSVKQDLSKLGQDKNKKTANVQMQKEIAQAQVTLDLRPDRTASLSLGSIGNQPPMKIDGNWEYKDTLVVVTLMPPGGAGAAVPMELVPSEDGKTLVTAGSQFGSLTFSR